MKAPLQIDGSSHRLVTTVGDVVVAQEIETLAITPPVVAWGDLRDWIEHIAERSGEEWYVDDDDTVGYHEGATLVLLTYEVEQWLKDRGVKVTAPEVEP